MTNKANIFKPILLHEIMSHKYRMSITPRRTLKNVVESIFRGRGNDITIGGREYALREYGNLQEQDLTREDMLRSLENQARAYPGVRHSLEVELENKPMELEEPTLRIRYIKAEDIPSVEDDKGTHQYMIVEGTRYRVEIEGSPKTLGKKMDQIMNDGRQMILNYEKEHGVLPNGIQIEQKLERN